MQNDPVAHCTSTQRASDLNGHLGVLAIAAMPTPALIELCIIMFSSSKFGTLSSVLVSTTTILTWPLSSNVVGRSFTDLKPASDDAVHSPPSSTDYD